MTLRLRALNAVLDVDLGELVLDGVVQDEDVLHDRTQLLERVPVVEFEVLPERVERLRLLLVRLDRMRAPVVGIRFDVEARQQAHQVASVIFALVVLAPCDRAEVRLDGEIFLVPLEGSLEVIERHVLDLQGRIQAACNLSHSFGTPVRTSISGGCCRP